jgi:hypothetical protein
MTEREGYHSHPALGSGDVKNLAVSYALFRAERENPFRNTSPSMDLGTAVHAALLEPHVFERKVVLLDDVPNFATKEGKALRDSLRKERGEDVLIFKGEDSWRIREMVASYRRLVDEVGNSFLEEPGWSEKPIFWHEELPGLEGKGLIDRWNTQRNWAFDVKTTSKVLTRRDVQRYAVDYGLHIQAAWYSRGIERAMGVAPERFLFLLISSVPPFSSALFVASQAFLEAGRAKVERALGNWIPPDEAPASDPLSGVFELELPAWATVEET